MILREIILAFAQVVDIAFSIYTFIIIGRALISWVNPDPYNPIVRFLYAATEPVMARLRQWLPLQFGGMDLTPIVLLVGLTFVGRIIKVILVQFAYNFG